MKRKSNKLNVILIILFLILIGSTSAIKYYEFNKLDNIQKNFIENIKSGLEESKSTHAFDNGKISYNYHINQVNINNIEQSSKDFLEEYYTVQSNWLNFWLTFLAALVSILIVAIPYFMKRKWEEQEMEFEEIKNSFVEKAQSRMEAIEKEFHTALETEQSDIISNLRIEYDEMSSDGQKEFEELKNDLLEELKTKVDNQILDDFDIRYELSEAIEESKKSIEDEIVNIKDDLWSYAQDKKDELKDD